MEEMMMYATYEEMLEVLGLTDEEVHTEVEA